MTRRHRLQVCNSPSPHPSPPGEGAGVGFPAMNFLQRRRILKKANFLHLTPVRMMDYRVNNDGKVDILLPRFRSKFWKDVYRKSTKGEFIYIHLDATGSVIWQQINGETSVENICSGIWEKEQASKNYSEDFQKRVTQFLSVLYQQKYISFKEILPSVSNG
jgi:hypothetical protein